MSQSAHRAGLKSCVSVRIPDDRQSLSVGGGARQPVVGVGAGGRFPCRLVPSVLRQTPALIDSPSAALLPIASISRAPSGRSDLDLEEAPLGGPGSDPHARAQVELP